MLEIKLKDMTVEQLRAYYRERARIHRERYGDAHREYIREYMKRYRATEEGRANVAKAQRKYEQKVRARRKSSKVYQDYPND